MSYDFNVLENGWYQIPFTKSDSTRTLVDALAVSPEEYPTLTDADIEQRIQQRFDDWVTVLKLIESLPPIEVVPE